MFSLSIPTFKFRSFFVLPYLILLISGLMLPSDGSHSLLNIKSLSFIGSVISLSTYLLIYQRLNGNQIKLICFLLISLSFLLVWTAISIVEAETRLDSTFDQFKLLLLTLCTTLMSLYIAEEKLVSYATFLKILVYSNFLYSLSKLLFVAFYLIGLVDLDSILSLIGIRYMTMTIYEDMSRLQTSVDIVTPFLLYFILQADRLKVHFSSSFKWCYVIISILSIFLSFSRFLWGVAFLSFALYWCTLRLYQVMRWLVFFLAIVIAAVSWIGWDTVYSVVEVRFYSLMNAESDSVRLQQIDALTTEFEQFPLFGKGLGGYSPEVIRDTVNFHSYEVQWMAFLMQFGVIGLCVFLIPLGWIGWQLIRPPLSRMSVGFFVLYLMWLTSGFFNPFLISLTSGIIYSLFALTGLKMPSPVKKDNNLLQQDRQI